MTVLYSICVNLSQAKFSFCFVIISPLYSFCYLSPFTILVVMFLVFTVIYWYMLTFLFVCKVFFIVRRAIVKMDKANKSLLLYYYYYYYYCYCYRYYYYYYYYYYCLGLPETAFPKRLTVFPLKITTNITDVKSNI